MALKVRLLKMKEEDFETLEDNQLVVQGMMASKYLATFEEQVSLTLTLTLTLLTLTPTLSLSLSLTLALTLALTLTRRDARGGARHPQEPWPHTRAQDHRPVRS